MTGNLSKEKRDKIINYLSYLKEIHSDDESIRSISEIENYIQEKKFGLVFEEHREEVDELLKDNIPVLTADSERRLCKDENLPWNFIIEGDNLQALYLLEKTHRGKVDCIYIDPPYNTGAKDWKYNNDYVDVNDSYRHSKWLSMMKRRLELARCLLNPESSVLIVTIDEKEYLHLGCLLEEMFSKSNIQMISSCINYTATARRNQFDRINEFIFFVMIGDCLINPQDESKNFKEGDEVNWRSLRRQNSSNIRDAQHPNQFFPIYVRKEDNKIIKVGDSIPIEMSIKDVPSIEGCETVWPIRENGKEMMWGISRDTFLQRLSKGYVKVGKHTPDKPQKYILSFLEKGTIEGIDNGDVKIIGERSDGSVIAIYNSQRKIMPKTQWTFKEHDAREYGTYLLDAVLGEKRFGYPKSLYAVYYSIKLFVENKHNAIILDFFAGSGTTMHAVNLINAEDGGKRKSIMVTNNEISLDEAKMLKEKGYNQGSPEWEKLGIAKYVTWPRTVCSIEGKNCRGETLKGDYISKSSTPIHMADGFKCNVKYMKCEWTPRKPDDYLLSNVLCLHIKEMIELQNAIEIDNIRNILIINRKDFYDYLISHKDASSIENVWYNDSIIFSSKELQLLKNLRSKTIPKEFFGQELKEAAE